MSGPASELGAPGVYRAPPTLRSPLAGERLDVCAFVGITIRGPAHVPIVDEHWRSDQPTVGPTRRRRRSVARRVGSWAEFVHVYGGLRGPGRLPWAVRAFFDQGGVEAWIVRITAPIQFQDKKPIGIGVVDLEHLEFDGAPVQLLARNEGSWSNDMRASVGFARTPQSFGVVGLAELSFSLGEAPPPGSLLRAGFDAPGSELRFVTGLVIDRTGRRVHASLSAPWSAVPKRLDVVTATLWLDDGAGTQELHRELGLSALHPRWLATVLCHESDLAFPDERWVEALELVVAPTLPPLDRTRTRMFADGLDRHAELLVEHFFDPDWDPRSERPGDGIAALADVPMVASVVVPDLYHPQALIDDQPVLDVDDDLGTADWATCIDEIEPSAVAKQDPNTDTLPGLIRDLPVQIDDVAASQQAVVEVAERLGIVALLDVPPGLDQRRILAWRQRFSSSWAAAYHPWLRLAQTSEDPDRETPMRLGPAAVAAGIIARRELSFGVAHGPANELAVGVIDVEDRVSPRRHDELHPRAINVLMRERDGVRLTAARTLSSDPSVRQLSVRRLMQLLTRSLERRLEWAVFEPNDESLRTRLRELLCAFLRELHRAGALRGEAEDEAFFVRCDPSNNPAYATERGELLVEIGVAPAEPIEFIVLAICRTGDQLEVIQR